MSLPKSPTGNDLPTTFVERRTRRGRWYGAAFHQMHLGVDDPWIGGLWPAPGTVPLHAREGLSSHTWGSGLLIGGTSSDAIALEDAPALRGALTLLDAWRVGDDGEPIRIEGGDVGHVCPVVVAQIKVHEPADFWGAGQAGEFSQYVEQDTSSREQHAHAEPLPREEPATEHRLRMETLARSMVDVPAAVSVSRPEVPELTGSSLEDAKRLFALTATQLAGLFGVTERQMRRYLADGDLPSSRQKTADALAAIGLTVVGGLGPRGAQDWLYSGAPSGDQLVRSGRIGELAERADALRDSPFT